MSGFSSPAASPRARSRSRSPTLNTTKQLPSIPEDLEPTTAFPRPPSPPPYDEQDEERAALIREHLHRVFELVNSSEQAVQLHQQRAGRPFQHRVQYNFDPEWHGAQASEFYQAARRRQQAQILGLLLFGLFIFSFVGFFVFFVVVAIRSHGRTAAEWEKRRLCLVSHGRAPHCQGSSVYNRW
ncbi:hypothetical protein RB594_001209 [Gaeumannomyces avenae]